MNGETAQKSGIVMSARKALHDGEEIKYCLDSYVLSIKFVFHSGGKNAENKKEAKSISEWFDICRRWGLEDIKFMIPTSVADRSILGFSNTVGDSIVCFWNDKSVTYFTSRWEFDRDNKGWMVLYEEHEWKDAPQGKPFFVNRVEEFKQVLSDIEAFAKRIDCDNFARIFHRAYEALCDSAGEEGDESEDYIPDAVPDMFRGIYRAIMAADVFGAMGSWNDEPPYYAYEKGLENEYNSLSNKLLEQLRYNLMYIVNESWNKDCN